MVATADLWVYNAEKILSLFFLYFSFFNQVTSIFHLRGGEIKKNWAYLAYTYDPVKVKVQQ